MATGLLKKLLKEKSVRTMEIDSAGIAALPGSPASYNAIRVAQENSVSLVKHEAKLVTPELIDKADLILVMDSAQRQQLISLYAEASDIVLLLRRFARFGSRDRPINDPYGTNIEAYRFCFEDIRECVESLHEWLLERF
jgi:protein-tyrosine-phosphatase